MKFKSLSALRKIFKPEEVALNSFFFKFSQLYVGR